VSGPSLRSPSSGSPQDKARLLALLLFAGVLFFFQLGSVGLFDADEPAYAGAARTMLERGDWVTPQFNGRARFDKPILFYWLIALSDRLLGVSEFALRCWSALAGVGLVLLVARAGVRWFGERAGLTAGLALAANPLTVLLGRAGVTDMLLALCMTAGLLAALAALGEAPGWKSGRWVALAWAGMALAVLVKGPIGLLFPALVLGGTALVLREVRPTLRRLLPWWGPAIFLALAGPWYALVLAANGRAFIDGFVIKHHLDRYTGVISSHAGPLWYYLPVLLIGFFPWSAFVPRGLWAATLVARRRRAGTSAERVVVACAVWVAMVFLFFSLAATKLPSYLFPAFPALALLVGALGQPAGATVPGSGSPSFPAGAVEPVPPWLDGLALWLLGGLGALQAIGAVLAPALLAAARPAARGVLDGVVIPAGLVGGVAGLFVLGTAAGLLARPAWRPAVLATMVGALVLTAVLWIAPTVYEIQQGALREYAQEARRTLGPEGALVAYGLNAPSVVFYAHRIVTPLGSSSPEDAERLRRLVASGRPVLVIARAAEASRLAEVPGLEPARSRGGYVLYGSRGLAPGPGGGRTTP
jgi:4-amino-4-deoxy-L-arabinose transferase-like glycosyltransferase